MKASELREKNEAELLKLLSETREKLLKLRFKIQSGEFKRVSEIKKTKKDIARILTILHEKRLKKS